MFSSFYYIFTMYGTTRNVKEKGGAIDLHMSDIEGKKRKADREREPLPCLSIFYYLFLKHSIHPIAVLYSSIGIIKGAGSVVEIIFPFSLITGAV